MFISEDEAARRIQTSENLLARARRDSSDVEKALSDGDIPKFEPTLGDVVEGEVTPTEDNALEGFVKSAIASRGINGKRKYNRLTPEERAGVGTMAALVTARAAGEAFDVFRQHADELKHGFTSSADRYGHPAAGHEKKDPNQDLLDRIKGNQLKVADVTFDKLLKALGLLDDEKIEGVKDALKLSHLAGNLSRILSNVTPKEAPNAQNVHFHVWRPDMGEEQDYRVIDISGESPEPNHV
jgi:hypothetical protein